MSSNVYEHRTNGLIDDAEISLYNFSHNVCGLSTNFQILIKEANEKCITSICSEAH